ncbi:VWA domain-containing protein, partial [Bordetella holmesii]|uniref:VWA domain-containing protein n=1 Tax=Bordetella holmesii TaxID=35814 RepID=UPI001A98CEE8
MDPPPQIVFFMTDGAVGERDMMKLTNDLASKAKKKGIIVNTIAMMEPKANEAMANLANKTGGEFTIIDKNGK